MQLTGSKRRPGKAQRFRARVKVPAGVKWVRVQDRARAHRPGREHLALLELDQLHPRQRGPRGASANAGGRTAKKGITVRK